MPLQKTCDQIHSTPSCFRCIVCETMYTGDRCYQCNATYNVRSKNMIPFKYNNIEASDELRSHNHDKMAAIKILLQDNDYLQNFFFVPIRGDGNCFFRSFLVGLQDLFITNPTLKKNVTPYIYKYQGLMYFQSFINFVYHNDNIS